MGLKSTKVKYVELPHTDATAQPKDVEKGKVFYNNDGRQVGDFPDSLNLDFLKMIYGDNVKSIVFNKNSTLNNNFTFEYGEGVKLGDLLKVQSNTNYTNKNITGASPRYSGQVIGFEFNKNIILFPKCEAGDDYQGRNTLFFFEILDEIKVFCFKNPLQFCVKIETTSSSEITIFYK